ncbi:MAG: hypothetical protein A2474_05725 [Elusimicrobia bacterium RIFOXYC2_FULL_34_12]|nr:MAG: hypothetical protein A2474_05725 [Elusimicrobia bacterium RIFOXYC2_FULL_34_12]HAM38958.1 hypothetical protein [Elusimicrobiota bacterium]
MKVRNITLILLIIVFFVQGCHKTNHKNKIYGSGTIETNEINISAKVIGRIAYLSVKEGQLINKGDLIVKLDELGKSEKDFIRAKKLFSENVISEDQLEQTQKIRDNFIIFSPISGIVILQQLLEGEIVTPGLPIVTLANMNDLWVKIYIPEIDIGRIGLGSKAEVIFDSFPSEIFEGEVINIAKKAEFIPKNIQTKEERVTQVFAVKVSVSNKDNKLKIGMPADVYIIKSN